MVMIENQQGHESMQPAGVLLTFRQVRHAGSCAGGGRTKNFVTVHKKAVILITRLCIHDRNIRNNGNCQRKYLDMRTIRILARIATVYETAGKGIMSRLYQCIP